MSQVICLHSLLVPIKQFMICSLNSQGTQDISRRLAWVFSPKKKNNLERLLKTWNSTKVIYWISSVQTCMYIKSACVWKHFEKSKKKWITSFESLSSTVCLGKCVNLYNWQSVGNAEGVISNATAHKKIPIHLYSGVQIGVKGKKKAERQSWNEFSRNQRLVIYRLSHYFLNILAERERSHANVNLSRILFKTAEPLVCFFGILSFIVELSQPLKIKGKTLYCK